MLAFRLLAAALFVVTHIGTAFAQAGAPVTLSEARFVRTQGRPDTFERTVIVPPWVVGPFTLKVQNGDPNGSDRLVLGWIWINGKRVVAPSDFRRDRSRRFDNEHERSSFADREDDEDERAERRRGGPPSGGVITRVITLDARNTVRIRLAGRRARYITVTMTGVGADRTAPQLTLLEPSVPVVGGQSVPVRWSYTDPAGAGEPGASGVMPSTVRVTVDGIDLTSAFVTTATEASASPVLADGSHVVAAQLGDAAGNVSTASSAFMVDSTPPILTLLSPSSETTTSSSEVTVTGTVDELTLQSVTVNGIAAAPGQQFEALVPLIEGDNVIVVTVTDATGRSSSAQVRVTRIIENPCDYAVSPSSAAVPADGARGVLAVSTIAGCPWSVSANADWITITGIGVGYAGAVVGDGAAGFWRLDDLESGALRDSSGQRLDGTLAGSYTQGVSGALADGNAATLLDGGLVQFANAPALLGGPFSVEVWLREPWWGTVVSGLGWQLAIEGGRVRFRAERNEVERFNVLSERSIDDGEWHHVVGTYDPAHQTTSMFVDGVLDATGPTPASPLNGDAFLMIGPVAATLDEVAVYRSALTAAQVAAHFDRRASAGGGSGSVSYTVAPNPAFEPRAAVVDVAGFAVAIAQFASESVPPDVGGVPPDRPGFRFSVAAGAMHSLALKDDGTAWSWGANGSSQLGDGTTIDRPLPAPVADLADVVAIAAGDAHSLALKSDGTVWAFGANGWGQLGDGTVTFRTGVVRASALADVVAIAAGSEHNVALTADGTVWTWGRNNVGQLGDGANAARTVPAPVQGFTSRAVAVAAAGTRTFVVDASGRLWEWGFGTFTPSQVALPAKAVAMSASASGWFAVTPDGDVWASTPDGPVLYGPHMPVPTAAEGLVGVVAVSENANKSFGLAVSADGRVWSWGNNESRQLGDGTGVSRSSPAPIADAGFLWHTGTPVMTAGGIFNAEWVARAASATPGAVIHYTVNGAEPTEADPIMPAAPAGIAITQTTTLRTRAWGAGKPPSGIASETYTLRVPAVSVTPSSGAYTSELLVSLTTGTAGTTIRYTVDGSDPTAASPAYSAPITVAIATVVKASAFRSGWMPSDVIAATYSFDIGSTAPPPVTPPPPRQPGCSYQLTPGAVAAPSQPTSGELSVIASDESCGWSVGADAAWLSVAASGGTSPYAQAVAADRPVGYWRLTEPIGATVASDASGFGRAALVSGGVTFGSAGPLADGSTAAAFDGRSGAIEVAHDAALDLTALTWEAWVNVPQTSSEWRWILGEGGSDEVFSLWIAPGSHRATLYYDLAGRGRQAVLLNTTLVGAGWVHLAFAYGATAWHAYVNGAEDQSGPSGGALATSTGPIVFGRDYVGGSWYDGELAEPALYPYVLSPDAIAYHVAQRSVMVRGRGRVTYVVTANVASVSRRATMTIAGTSVPVVQAAQGGIAIAGSPSPGFVGGASGWINSDVTVTFACAGEGVIACPAPVFLSRDGEHDVSGQAVSDAGGTASTTVHVRVDKTVPYLSVSAPSLGQLVSAGAITLRGSSIDLLSGLAGVTCNGQPATLSDTQFVCSLTAPPGTSTVTLRASDVASNMRETIVSVTTEDVVAAVPPTRLRVTPQRVTMVAGETRRFSVLDDFDRVPGQAEWTIDNAAVATLSAAPQVELTAVSAGVVVLTARWQGLTASTEVTVIGAAAPVGTTVWSQPPVHGSVERIVQGAVTLDNERRIYVLEHDDSLAQDLIRAFDVDGREVWATNVSGRVIQLSGDPFGGVVALYGDTIAGFTPGGNGFPVGTGSGPGFAIDADAAVYYVREGVLMAGSGSLPLPEAETPGGWIDPGIPTVLEDGRVAVPVHVTNTGVTPDKVQLVVNAPDGGTSVQTVWESPAAILLQDGSWLRPPPDAVTPYKAVPNGHGDILVAWSAVHASLGSGGNPASAYLGVVRADGQTSGYLAEVGGIWGIPGRYPYGDLVVAEDRIIATAYRLFDQQNDAVASQLTLTGSLVSQDSWGAPEGQVPQLPTFLAAAGGGFIVSYPNGTMGGVDPAFSGMRLVHAQYQGDGTWIGTVNRGPAAVTGPAVAEPNSVWSAAQGGQQWANVATKPGQGILLKGHLLFPGINHASVRVVPRHVDKWFREQPQIFYTRDEHGSLSIPNYDSYGNRFFTLGAGPDATHDTLDSECVVHPHDVVATLTSGINRDGDVHNPAVDIAPVFYNRVMEDRYIADLFARHAAYANDLPYVCVPRDDNQGFNSNSYVAGLLKAAGTGPPSFLYRQNLLTCNPQNPYGCDRYPGWQKPVPVERFK